MSTIKAGNDFQDWVTKFLRKEGWDVYNQKVITRLIVTGSGKRIWHSGRQDLFACDIIALQKNRKVLFIQATLASGIKKRLTEFQKYAFPLDHCQVELWIKRKEGEITIKEYYDNDLHDTCKIIRGKRYYAENLLRGKRYFKTEESLH